MRAPLKWWCTSFRMHDHERDICVVCGGAGLLACIPLRTTIGLFDDVDPGTSVADFYCLGDSGDIVSLGVARYARSPRSPSGPATTGPYVGVRGGMGHQALCSERMHLGPVRERTFFVPCKELGMSLFARTSSASKGGTCFSTTQEVRITRRIPAGCVDLSGRGAPADSLPTMLAWPPDECLSRAALDRLGVLMHPGSHAPAHMHGAHLRFVGRFGACASMASRSQAVLRYL